MELTKTFSFATAHRLPMHNGHCTNIHGHNYDIEVKIDCEDPDLYIDGVGYVIDFGEIKRIVNEMYDHKLVLHREDEWAAKMEKLGVPGLVIVDFAPTSENMATDIALRIQKALKSLGCHAPKIQINLWETSSSYVTKTLE